MKSFVHLFWKILQAIWWQHFSPSVFQLQAFGRYSETYVFYYNPSHGSAVVSLALGCRQVPPTVSRNSYQEDNRISYLIMTGGSPRNHLSLSFPHTRSRKPRMQIPGHKLRVSQELSRRKTRQMGEKALEEFQCPTPNGTNCRNLRARGSLNFVGWKLDQEAEQEDENRDLNLQDRQPEWNIEEGIQATSQLYSKPCRISIYTYR